MPLVFTAIVPHSPLLVPTIGKEHQAQCTATLAALKLLKQQLNTVRADLICMLSPHGNETAFITPLTSPDPVVVGHLKEFGDLAHIRTYPISTALFASPFPPPINESVRVSSASELDYGMTVPLLFLTDEDREPLAIAPIRTSEKSAQTHYDFGAALGERFHEHTERIALIASAELSHVHHEPQLTAAAVEFDQTLQDALSARDLETLLHTLRERARDMKACGAAPLAVLVGILASLRTEFSLLAYEHPLGVGLLTAEIKIQYV